MPSAGAPDLGHARPIVGWVEFCARYASECAVDVNEPAQVTLTPRLWQTVTGINRQVNTSLRAVTDQEHWGVPDRWDLPRTARAIARTSSSSSASCSPRPGCRAGRCG